MINKRVVEHVARLSRLDLEEGEKDLFVRQLGAILDYMEKLKELDTTPVEPYFYAGVQGDHFRSDEPLKSLERDRALQNAPEKEMGFYKVPPTFEREAEPEREENGNP